ncbi:MULTISPECIES: sensor histidine kinase [unclassified Flavobacterium]|uniref:tetratricopeptide repeat-containing sensor histidine kinase n=2 Tax=Flavobacterium TaxID=237 RepID=UPI0025BBDDD8|nr:MULTISPECIES: sensor histidine kinase [unclassified Flavobacterium]
MAKAYSYIAKAYSNENQSGKSFEFYKKSEITYLSAGQKEQAMEVTLDIAYLFSTQKHTFEKAKGLIQEYILFAKEMDKDDLIAKGYESWASMHIVDNPEESKKYFKKALAHNTKSFNEQTYSTINNNLGVLYSERLAKPDSALYFYYKNLDISIKNNDVDEVCTNYINIAGAYYYKGEHKKAIDFLNKAQEIDIKKYRNKTKSLIHKFISFNYEALGDYENAYNNLFEYKILEDKINAEMQDIKVSELQIFYETKEKDLENISLKNQNSLLESKRKINLLVLFVLIGVLISIILISLLTIKNAKKKQLIAEQEKLLEKQKLATTLKEHELQNIDLMLESQENERIKMANELHDNLGSMLATLKLNFQNLKRQKEGLIDEENKLYEKTDHLIEEAYQKVRDMAHFKNSGIVGNEGLVPAVKKMADKMSVLNLLEMNVIPFGLKDRLDNKLEVSLFRMIQELCTNIIKHAKASEVNIYLTQHNGTDINLIIEDNGIGFDPKAVKSSDGMGLKNIEKKVEQMGGTFSIDTIKNKGTTIIIDIPL